MNALPPPELTAVQTLDPAVARVWRTVVLLVAVPCVLIFTLLAITSWGDAPIVAALPLTLTLIITAGLLHWNGLRARRFTYRFGPDALEIARGVWFREFVAIPYHRVQQVDMARGPLQRRAGLTSLRLRTAAAAATVSIPGVRDAQAEHLRQAILARAGHDDGA